MVELYLNVTGLGSFPFLAFEADLENHLFVLVLQSPQISREIRSQPPHNSLFGKYSKRSSNQRQLRLRLQQCIFLCISEMIGRSKRARDSSDDQISPRIREQGDFVLGHIPLKLNLLGVDEGGALVAHTLEVVLFVLLAHWVIEQQKNGLANKELQPSIPAGINLFLQHITQQNIFQIRCYYLISLFNIMLRLGIHRYFNSTYRPMRPLIAERTTIFQASPTPRPNILLYQVPAVLVIANNILTSWSLLSTGGFLLALIAGNAAYFFRMVKWSSTVTHISTNQKFDRLFLKFNSQKLFQSIKIPPSDYFAFNTQTNEFEINRGALSQDSTDKKWPKQISEVDMNRAYTMDILNMNKDNETYLTGILLKIDPSRNSVKGYQQYIRALIAMKDVDSDVNT